MLKEDAERGYAIIGKMEKLRWGNVEKEAEVAAGVAMPLSEVLRSAKAAAEIWTDEIGELASQIERRAEIAEKIEGYLAMEQAGLSETELKEKRAEYFEAVSKLLDDPEYERIALFLPFESWSEAEEESQAADRFRTSLISAWQDLLFTRDVRANFVDGDVIEVGARREDPERVVKAAHLTPWLVKKEMVSVGDVLDIMEYENDEMLSRSFLETVPMMEDMGLLSESEKREFEAIAVRLPEKAEVLPPKYMTLARREWLKEKEKAIKRPEGRTAEMEKLAEGVVERLPALEGEIGVAKELAEKTTGVVLIGGSRVKGYGRPESDVDLAVVAESTAEGKEKLAKIGEREVRVIALEEVRAKAPRYAHEVFGTVMVGDEEKVKDAQREMGLVYLREDDEQKRRQSIERLEQDKLEYRLLHKGYPRLCPDTNPEYKKYVEMDGQSAFYETGYRVIATRIFAREIFIPKIRKKESD